MTRDAADQSAGNSKHHSFCEEDHLERSYANPERFQDSNVALFLKDDGDKDVGYSESCDNEDKDDKEEGNVVVSLE